MFYTPPRHQNNLINSPLYQRARIPMARSLTHLFPTPTTPPSLSSPNAVSPRRQSPPPPNRSGSPRPPAAREPTARIARCRSRAEPGRSEPEAPSLKPSQGQYATLYLAPPPHLPRATQLCSALSPLARLPACAPPPPLHLSLSLSLAWLARVPELETLAIPPRETLTLAPRTAAGGRGSAGAARRRRSRSRRRRAEAALIEVGLA
jgi:hypothetical protein